ncbi:MAG TPA: hypothetical protein VN279_04055, partial [Rhodocyclaceae bacterium]|nr:hypothetical protein [Rhodocyclaceae bacterium]
AGGVGQQPRARESLRRHPGDAPKIERRGVGGAARPVDRPLQPGHVRQVGERGDRRIRGEESRELAAVVVQVAALAYLPDVARLEWAIDRARRAADAAPLDPAALAEISPERLQGTRLLPHPACALIASPWPVLRIWQVNQPDYPGDAAVDLDEGGDRLLVRRPADEPEVEPLPEADFAFLSALFAGATLGAAFEETLARFPGFDLAAALRRHVLSGTLCGIA